MIDEKLLIEELKKRVRTPRSTMEILRDIIPFVEAQPKVVTDTNVGCKWIPCSERLPLEEYESDKIVRGENAVYPVLITIKAFSFEENREKNIVKKAWFFDYMGKTDFYNSDLKRVEAIAWMSLPAPYNEDMRKKVE